MPIRPDARHETAGAGRHRDLLYQQLSAEILREVHDQHSLDLVSNRVLNHSEVCRDSQLASMLRTCIGQAANELNARLARVRAEGERPVARASPAASQPVAPANEFSQREQALASFERLRRLYDEKLVSFELDAAKRLMTQIEEFQQLHPTIISAPMIQRCRMDLAGAERRQAEFANEIEELAK